EPSRLLLARRGRGLARRFAASGSGDASLSQAAGKRRFSSSRSDAAFAGRRSAERLGNRNSRGGRKRQAAGKMAGPESSRLHPQARSISSKDHVGTDAFVRPAQQSSAVFSP